MIASRDTNIMMILWRVKTTIKTVRTETKEVYCEAAIKPGTSLRARRTPPSGPPMRQRKQAVLTLT